MTASATSAATPTATATPISGAVSDNSFGTGLLPNSTIPGTVEPVQSNRPGLFLMSIVAIQGLGGIDSTGAAAAFICLPDTPGPWVLISNWACDGGGANQIQVAAAYRFTDERDDPGTPFTWSFSSTPCNNPTAETFLGSVTNTLYSGINSTPFDNIDPTPACSLGSAGSTIVSPPVTTNHYNDLIVGAFDAEGAGQFLSLPQSGSDLSPVVSESNTNQGPGNFTSFANTVNVGHFNQGEFGAPGTYGPFSAVQAAGGESLSISLSVITNNHTPTPTSTSTPTPTPTATATSTATPTPTATATPRVMVSGSQIHVNKPPGSTVSGGTFQVCNKSTVALTLSNLTISFDNADLFTTSTLTGTQGPNTVTSTIEPITGGDSPEHPNNTAYNFSPLGIPGGQCANFSLSVTITLHPEITMGHPLATYASLIAVSGPNSSRANLLLGAFAIVGLCSVMLGGTRRRRIAIAATLFLAAIATQSGCDNGSTSGQVNELPQSLQTVMRVPITTQAGESVPASGLPVIISMVETNQ